MLRRRNAAFAFKQQALPPAELAEHKRSTIGRLSTQNTKNHWCMGSNPRVASGLAAAFLFYF
jgi:hypothetical protein